MRKLMLVAIVSLNLLGLNLSFNTEVGFLPSCEFLMYKSDLRDERIVKSLSFYVDLETFLEWKYFYIGGGIKTHIWKCRDNYTFSPDGSFYSLAFGFTFNKIEIGMRHYCIHPIVPYMTYTKPEPQWEGAYEEIFIRFSGNTGR